jgi:hypothetical protein
MRRLSLYKVFVVFFICLFFPNSLLGSSSQTSQVKISLTTSFSQIKVSEQTILLAHVTDLEGNPISNRVLSISSDGVSGRFLPDTQTLRTDSKGQAEVIWQAGLNPGKATIYASLNGYARGIANLEIMVDPDPKAEQNGRITVTMSKQCAEGTTVQIFDKTNQLIATLFPDGTGVYDTGCILICDDTYIVKPINSKCSFNPTQMHVQAKCCPLSGTFNFTCECEDPPPMASISVIVPKTCSSGTVIGIFNSHQEKVLSLIPDSSGVATSSCELECNEIYYAVPYNKNCQFLPISKPIKTVCCPAGNTITFVKCSCSDDLELGKIRVDLPPYDLENTIVRISLENVKIVDLKPDPYDGNFETNCNLSCNMVYKVEPINPNCTFSPAFQTVKATCCSLKTITPITFTNNCVPTTYLGKIKVKVPKNCLSGNLGTWIDIENVDTYQSYGQYFPNSEGIVETPCRFECGATYRIRPMSLNCAFTPPYTTVIAKCCPDYGYVDFTSIQSGRVAVKLPSNCLKDTVVKVQDKLGFVVDTLTKSGVGGVYESSCDLVVGDTYTFIPSNPTCNFSPEHLEMVATGCGTLDKVSFDSCDCEEPVDGKIVIKLPTDCTKKTTIKISVTDGSNAPPIYLSALPDGSFDSGCKLQAGSYYLIEPSNSSCQFTPKTKSVQAIKCDDTTSSSVTFNCSCTITKNGKIGVKIPVSCLSATKITVQEVGKTSKSYLTTANSDGVFESLCNLICDREYLVTPVSASRTFSPASMTITAKCCPDFDIAIFDGCAPLKTGKISVTIPGSYVSGTSIKVTDKNGVAVMELTSYISGGVFESTCNLTCDETYTVTPVNTNPNCIFTPAFMTVVAKCCPSTGSVSFTSCTCEKKKGSIVVQLPKDCTPKTSIRITAMDSVSTPRYLSPNASGLFDSGCVLYCGDSYKVEPVGTGCTYTPAYQIVKASCCTTTPPTPISFACSCRPAQNGKIAVQLPVSAMKDAKIYVTTLSGAFVTQLTVGNSTGLFESECTLVCGTTYKVTPSHPSCTFSPTYQTVVAKCCPSYGLVTFTKYTCPPVKNGKIAVKIPLNCLTNTKITISELNGTNPMQLITPNASGIFETNCSLVCGTTYRVTPTNPTCTFTPGYLTVVAKCCPDFNTVEFTKCTCPPAKTGKIAVKIPLNCLTNTKITVSELSGANPMQLTKASPEGVFETPCTLTCGTTYKVTPYNSTCKFEPTYLSVVAKCCPEFNTVEFTKCTCPPAKTGKIKVQLPLNSISGTRVYLIDSKGTATVLTIGSTSTGIFESTCTLICDETYTVQPMNSYFTFSPATQKVAAKCCPSFGSATFNATRKSFLHNYLWSRRFDLETI